LIGFLEALLFRGVSTTQILLLERLLTRVENFSTTVRAVPLLFPYSSTTIFTYHPEPHIPSQDLEVFNCDFQLGFMVIIRTITPNFI
jgi:hypothetical protein